MKEQYIYIKNDHTEPPGCYKVGVCDFFSCILKQIMHTVFLRSAFLKNCLIMGNQFSRKKKQTLMRLTCEARFRRS